MASRLDHREIPSKRSRLTFDPVFEEPYLVGFGGRAYDIAPDGQRFLMIKEGTGGGGDPGAPIRTESLSRRTSRAEAISTHATCSGYRGPAADHHSVVMRPRRRTGTSRTTPTGSPPRVSGARRPRLPSGRRAQSSRCRSTSRQASGLETRNAAAPRCVRQRRTRPGAGPWPRCLANEERALMLQRAPRSTNTIPTWSTMTLFSAIRKK